LERAHDPGNGGPVPDSPLGALQERVARLEQRADDLMQRVLERFGDFAEDIRVFAPLVREHDEMRAEMRFVRESVTTLLAHLGALEKRIEQEREDRIKGQAERKAELEEATAARSAEIAKMERDREAREEAQKAEVERQRRDFRVKYIQIMAGIVSIFLTSLGGVAIAYISQRGGIK
jgi:chromosome segregation ATPase